MHIHHHIAHGLNYSMDAAELYQMEFGEISGNDEADWDELDTQYDDETLATNVIAFLHELDD